MGLQSSDWRSEGSKNRMDSRRGTLDGAGVGDFKVMWVEVWGLEE